MTDVGIVALPRHAVVPIAGATTHRAKIIAAVYAVLAAACLLSGVADAVGHASRNRDDAAAVFWAVIFGVAAGFAVRRAKRATAAGQRAAADADTTWTLVGMLVVAGDNRGRPGPEHSFKITGAQRKLLLAGPTKAIGFESPAG